MLTRKTFAVAGLAALAACSPDLTAPPSGVVAVGSSANITTTTTISDDFSAGVLDLGKWAVVTSPIPGDCCGYPMYAMANGGIDLANRAHLNTVQSFNGNLHITGEWTITGAGDDFIQVLTRSSGQPGGEYGETTSGINFIACSSWIGECPSFMGIQGPGVTVTGETGSLSVDPYTTFLFDVVDNGTTLSFTLSRKDNPSVTRTVTATAASAGSGLVTFHNREVCCGGWHTASLDNISITSSVTVTPAQALTNLASTINSLGLSASEAAGFTDKITSAQQSIAAGRNNTAKNQLNALLNHIKARTGKSGGITAAQAASLTAAVNAIIAEL